MQLRLVPRSDPGLARQVLTPIIAFALALIIGGLCVAAMGKSPWQAFAIYFVQPLTDSWALQALLLKATPLVIIAIGLSFCFRANRWNIGAEGQYIMGALAGSWIAIAASGWAHASFLIPVAFAAAMVAGAAYAGIAAFLRNRLGVNEILTSLMLVYVAQLLLDYLVRGPWRDPASVGFPQSVSFSAMALPFVFGDLHIGVVIAALIVGIGAFILGRTRFGFAVSATGEAPKAATFAGFNDQSVTMAVLLISGALAGLAGMIEVLGPIGRLQPSISPGYGFTAIIVAFLGRLSPVAILVAALAIALTLIGNETAQITLKLPLDLGRLFQGLLLFLVLAGDTLTRYRLVLDQPDRRAV